MFLDLHAAHHHGRNIQNPRILYTMTKEGKYENHLTLSNNEDTELLKSFLTGNDDAFTSIYHKYVDGLFVYGVGLGFNRDVLKDVIQDVFYKFYFDKDKLREVRQLKSFLFTMLRNKLFDMYRFSVDTTDVKTFEMSFTVHSTIIDDIIGEEERKILQKRIDKLMEKLTDRQREAIFLRFIQEMEYEEIGKLLDMNTTSVRKLVSRAIQRMRE